MRRVAKVHLKSLSKYRSTRNHMIPKKTKEGNDEFTERTWKELAHYDDKGFMMIPSVAFKKSVMTMAAIEKEKVKDKGNQEWGRRFKTGLRVANNLRLPFKRETLKCDTFPMKRKDGNAVVVKFPVAEKWEGCVEFHLYDSVITDKIFERYVREAGVRVGVGQGRPENGGENGCWEVEKIVWSTDEE